MSLAAQPEESATALSKGLTVQAALGPGGPRRLGRAAIHSDLPVRQRACAQELTSCKSVQSPRASGCRPAELLEACRAAPHQQAQSGPGAPVWFSTSGKGVADLHIYASGRSAEVLHLPGVQLLSDVRPGVLSLCLIKIK